jgi:hypothetical protein
MPRIRPIPTKRTKYLSFLKKSAADRKRATVYVVPRDQPADIPGIDGFLPFVEAVDVETGERR